MPISSPRAAVHSPPGRSKNHAAAAKGRPGTNRPPKAPSSAARRAARCGSTCQSEAGGAGIEASVTRAPSGSRAGGGGRGRTAQTVAGRPRYWAAWISAATSSM
ncbi:hypothetical protein G6F40_016835 [Rhizopus arrhizus]|nr:hypothetical protein G6F40_016835 [Rhizopus arrhizus]